MRLPPCPAVLLGVAFTVAAPALVETQRARQTESRAERPVPFKAGEALTYDVTWSNFLTAGTATVTVREKRPSFGSEAYHIVAEGKPSALLAALYPVYYKADTLLETRTLLPQRGAIYSSEGDRRRLRETRFDHAARRARYSVQGGDPLAAMSSDETPLPPQTQDPLSAVFVIRAMPMTPGTTVTLPVAMNGTVKKLQVVFGQREQVRTGIGELPAWRIVPTFVEGADESDGKGLVLWISDDARRLPLKLQGEMPMGAFVLTLVSAR